MADRTTNHALRSYWAVWACVLAIAFPATTAAQNTTELKTTPDKAPAQQPIFEQTYPIKTNEVMTQEPVQGTGGALPIRVNVTTPLELQEYHVGEPILVTATLVPSPAAGTEVTFCFDWFDCSSLASACSVPSDKRYASLLQERRCQKSETATATDSYRYQVKGDYFLSVSVTYKGGNTGTTVPIYVRPQPAQPQTVKVPNVSGVKLGHAEQMLQQAGLSAMAQAKDKESLVMGSFPGAGTAVVPGSRVSLTTTRLSVTANQAEVDQPTRVTARLVPPPQAGTPVRYCFTWEASQQPTCTSADGTATMPHTYSVAGNRVLPVSAALIEGETIKENFPIVVSPKPQNPKSTSPSKTDTDGQSPVKPSTQFRVTLTAEPPNPEVGKAEQFTVGLDPSPAQGARVEYCFVWDNAPQPCESVSVVRRTFTQSGKHLVAVTAQVNGQPVGSQSLEIPVQKNPSGFPWIPLAAGGGFTVLAGRWMLHVRVKVVPKSGLAPKVTLNAQPAIEGEISIRAVRGEIVTSLIADSRVVIKNAPARGVAIKAKGAANVA